MRISKRTIEKGRLLALAYIRAKAGDAKAAGEMMVAACEGQDLDPIMHGVAEGLGFEEPEEDEDEEMKEPAGLGMDDEDCEDCDDDDDEPEVEEDEEEDEEEEEEVDEPAEKVEVPASVARLANMRY